ncbi:TIGR03085 family metal-binding protein [Luteipulveratus mongoliensis]|uniref:Mycothiol-dependent maleylpyruvate isomerase metal-binding domain-containing protein n=1 Tax=Luteipulveratus mongoliensis TaxID=571913 RepID=A0A0K1JJI8_9MICO|nr:TIGR03085 family metal-binding protein [Luteipulveratus mongoliensis]AKU16743.1 hypothetical protein VV02_14160 [Luteipulveratus mongoliensis]
MASLAQQERQALCDTFELVGPDADTLCAGWTTRDLAAHLVLRESRPDAAIGMFVSALSSHTDSVMSSLAAQPWEQLVQTVRSGPPFLSPFRIGAIDQVANTGEFFIHHEDVLRGVDPSARRELTSAAERELWPVVQRMAKMTLRGVDVGVEAQSDGHGEAVLRRGSGPEQTVTLKGAPGEILLSIAGRAGADGARADVEIDGPPDAVAAYRSATMGL